MDRNAAKKGASPVVFPESFIPCYPRALSFGMTFGGNSGKGRGDYERYFDNAVNVPEDLAPLCDAAKEGGIFVSIGVTEKDGGTLYCTNVLISDHGEILSRYRKIKPTAAERCLWGEGNEAPRAVKTPFGKVGALICWENYMPLARMALYSQDISVYLAPNADGRREFQATLRHIAQEGRVFVIACNQFVTKADYPRDLERYSDLESAIEEISPGGSCVISPTGKYIAPPVYRKEELIVCRLPLYKLPSARLDFDPCGHYSRPDLFEFKVK